MNRHDYTFLGYIAMIGVAGYLIGTGLGLLIRQATEILRPIVEYCPVEGGMCRETENNQPTPEFGE